MIVALAKAAGPIAQLNRDICGGKTLKLKDRYLCLKTRKKKLESWWNSLDWKNKVEVGEVAIHFGKITANYKWACQEYHKFSDLGNGQKRIIKSIFSQRNEVYHPLDMRTFNCFK